MSSTAPDKEMPPADQPMEASYQNGQTVCCPEDTFFGLVGRDQLPEEHRASFLLNDLILFKHGLARPPNKPKSQHYDNDEDDAPFRGLTPTCHWCKFEHDYGALFMLFVGTPMIALFMITMCPGFLWDETYCGKEDGPHLFDRVTGWVPTRLQLRARLLCGSWLRFCFVFSLQRRMKKPGVPFGQPGPRRDVLLEHGCITLRLDRAPAFCNGWGRLGNWVNALHEAYWDSTQANAAARACLELEKQGTLVPAQIRYGEDKDSESEKTEVTAYRVDGLRKDADKFKWLPWLAAHNVEDRSLCRP